MTATGTTRRLTISKESSSTLRRQLRSVASDERDRNRASACSLLPGRRMHSFLSSAGKAVRTSSLFALRVTQFSERMRLMTGDLSEDGEQVQGVRTCTILTCMMCVSTSSLESIEFRSEQHTSHVHTSKQARKHMMSTHLCKSLQVCLNDCLSVEFSNW